MPVKNHPAHEVTEDEHDGGTCRDAEAGKQCDEDQVARG
jgi:hypothetical protein